MNAQLEQKLLAAGVRESVYYMTGRLPTSRKPHALAWIGSYVVALAVIGAVIALLANQ